MATTVTIDPATRLEGHLKVELTSDQGKVVSARSSGLMFRGFESLLVGKNPRDAAHITQRICGVCPTNHAMAACLAMEAAAGLAAPDNARIVRNLILGADFVQSHILHFYHLAALDYVQGPATEPWTPSYGLDLRLSAADNQRMVDHYVAALGARRQASEMGALLGGKLPHTVAYEFGGVTRVPKADVISKFKTLLDQVIGFIDGSYIPDIELLARAYPDYFQIGRGYGNLLAFGVFDLNAQGSSKLLGRGRVAAGGTTVQSVDVAAITEQVKYGWYNNTAALNPANGQTAPNPTKAGAYSWLKAPRYSGQPYETGPLARMWVNGDYRNGISVMDRHMARALETRKIAYAMRTWLGQIDPSAAGFTARTLPASGSGIGLTEAPRGALGHWLKISGSVVASYQVVTPTCWNASPRDGAGVAGPIEKALEGAPVSDATRPIEALRVVHSFDPCLSCAVH